MSAKLDQFDRTYAGADARLGARDEVRIGHNTRLARRDGGIAVIYHTTAIVKYRPNGDTDLNTGGWYTVTTWARINDLLPPGWRVWSNRGTRTLYRDHQPVIAYLDRVYITADGAVGWQAITGDRGIIRTADEVDDRVNRGRVRDEVKADRRAARLVRQHAAGKHAGWYSVYDCPTCIAERPVPNVEEE